MEGYQVLDWIEEYVATQRPAKIPELYVHSQNSVARRRMLVIIDRINNLTLEL